MASDFERNYTRAKQFFDDGFTDDETAHHLKLDVKEVIKLRDKHESMSPTSKEETPTKEVDMSYDAIISRLFDKPYRREILSYLNHHSSTKDISSALQISYKLAKDVITELITNDFVKPKYDDTKYQTQVYFRTNLGSKTMLKYPVSATSHTVDNEKFYDQSETISLLKALHSNGTKITPKTLYYTAHKLHISCYKHFGSIKKALIAADIEKASVQKIKDLEKSNITDSLISASKSELQNISNTLVNIIVEELLKDKNRLSRERNAAVLLYVILRIIKSKGGKIDISIDELI